MVVHFFQIKTGFSEIDLSCNSEQIELRAEFLQQLNMT